MDWLNYHHLLYFYTVAREGSIARAAAVLRLSQPTVSEQIHALEESLGEALFARSGRGLQLTPTGELCFHYAAEIFALGGELLATVRGGAGRPRPFVVGISDAVPKLIAYRLLAPALRLPTQLSLCCREDRPERLVEALANHQLDLVLCDSAAPRPSPRGKGRIYPHLLGECSVTLFGTAALAARYREGFPASLAGAPLLLPGENAELRARLDGWLAQLGVTPTIVGEFDDSALLKAFGQGGAGLFPAPSAIEREVAEMFGVQIVGRVPAVRARFYALSTERRLRHPAVVAISQRARRDLFGDG